MKAQTIQFRRFPAEQARRLAGGPAWGRRARLSLGGSIALSLGSLVARTFAPPTAMVLLLAALGLLLFGVVGLGIWCWRSLRGPRQPWGRLLLAGVLASWVVDRVAQQQPAAGWAVGLGVLQWIVLIGLFIAFIRRSRAPATHDVAARWAAGVRGEDIVGEALARLGSDYVVIHNLPIVGRGDADHVVVGPAGVVVIETKYLAGRISCLGDGRWLQTKGDQVRQIGDPAAQVRRAAAALEDRLTRQGLWNVPVGAIVVMAHPHAELLVEQSVVLVVRPFELVPVFRQLERERRMLDGSAVQATVTALLDAPAWQRDREGSARYARV